MRQEWAFDERARPAERETATFCMYIRYVPAIRQHRTATDNMKYGVPPPLVWNGEESRICIFTPLTLSFSLVISAIADRYLSPSSDPLCPRRYRFDNNMIKRNSRASLPGDYACPLARRSPLLRRSRTHARSHSSLHNTLYDTRDLVGRRSFSSLDFVICTLFFS